jgi:hypothetical protein
MKRSWILAIIAANLAVLIALVFLYPEAMIGPGRLSVAHSDPPIACASCHLPFRGVTGEGCVTCHAVATIGLKTSAGEPLVRTRPGPAFHQALNTTDCLACHTGHAGPLLSHPARPGFSHDLLKAEVRARCEGCHSAPANALHRAVQGNCAACHTPAGWTPATFDHQRFFPLTGPHNVRCATCHTGGDFSGYTCFGCHEHRPAAILAEHREEGISDIRDCARCHRAGASREGGDDD